VVPSNIQSIFERTRGAKKILVVDLGFLGDSIHLIPALVAIKQNYPGAVLDVLSAPVGAEVLKLCPEVDAPRVFPLSEKSPAWWRHWSVIRSLRREKYDLTFNFSGADRTLFLSFLSGARWRVGQEGARKHFWSSILVPDLLPRIDSGLPVFRQKCEFLRRCGLSVVEEKFSLKVGGDARQWAIEKLPGPALHLSLSASTFMKEWPLERWIEFAGLVRAVHPQLQLVTTSSLKPREIERAEKFCDQTGALRFSGLSIQNLAALLSRCQAHVGADSGVLHLASALGRPTVAIFRQYSGLREWLPEGAGNAAVIAPCSCCNQGRFETCEKAGVARCLESISAVGVVEALAKVLKLRRGSTFSQPFPHAERE